MTLLKPTAILFHIVHNIGTKISTPFFTHSSLNKPISLWLLTYSTVHFHIINKLNSQNSTFETTHLKQLLLNTFVIHTNFKPANSLTNSNPFDSNCHKKSIQHLSNVTHELKAEDGSTFHTHRIIFYHTNPKNLLFSHSSVDIIQLLLFLIIQIQTLI